MHYLLNVGCLVYRLFCQGEGGGMQLPRCFQPTIDVIERFLRPESQSSCMSFLSSWVSKFHILLYVTDLNISNTLCIYKWQWSLPTDVHLQCNVVINVKNKTLWGYDGKMEQFDEAWHTTKLITFRKQQIPAVVFFVCVSPLGGESIIHSYQFNVIRITLFNNTHCHKAAYVDMD